MISPVGLLIFLGAVLCLFGGQRAPRHWDYRAPSAGEDRSIRIIGAILVLLGLIFLSLSLKP